MSKIRVGIDVGGTFTHAVAVSGEPPGIIGETKVLTTHDHPQGVAFGIIDSLKKLIENSSFNINDVTFIAHSTTQATNSLLEGDLCRVGIIGMGRGIEGLRAKREVDPGRIELSKEKLLRTSIRFIDTSKSVDNVLASAALDELSREGCGAVVLSEAFSVDDPANEDRLNRIALGKSMPAVPSHEISALYGLKVRTRTAALNAGILPMMIKTADDTYNSIKAAGVRAPLMVMRSDGGVISLSEMKKRPIQTIISGPAAGIAGALFYERISDGIFLDVGGTSTDISVIKDGRAKIRTGEVGGHRLYLKTLDVRTVGVAGGSLIRIRDGKIVDIGPRSAHIAGLPYASFSDPSEMNDLKAFAFRPKPDDPDDYVAVRASSGRSYAVTLTCAANALGKVKDSWYAFGSGESSRKAVGAVAKLLGKGTDEVAEEILNAGSEKILAHILRLIKEYRLEKDVLLAGGGGGAGALVPFVAGRMNTEFTVIDNHALISAVGAALSLLHDEVEKMVLDPKERDILEVRRMAEESVIKMGALPESVEVQVEFEAKKNIIRASASGAVEMDQSEISPSLSPSQKLTLAAKAMKTSEENVKLAAGTGFFDVFSAQKEEKRFFGLFKAAKYPFCVVDDRGTVRLKRGDGSVFLTAVKNAQDQISRLIGSKSMYNDAGERLPDIFLLVRSKMIDLSGLVSEDHVRAVAGIELKKFEKDDPVVLLASAD